MNKLQSYLVACLVLVVLFSLGSSFQHQAQSSYYTAFRWISGSYGDARTSVTRSNITATNRDSANATIPSHGGTAAVASNATLTGEATEDGTAATTTAATPRTPGARAGHEDASQDYKEFELDSEEWFWGNSANLTFLTKMRLSVKDWALRL